MNEIAGQQARITDALQRIEAALAAKSEAPAMVPAEAMAEIEAARDAAERAAEAARAEAEEARNEVETLRQALEAETVANSQLRERVAALKEKKETQSNEIAQIDAERQRLAEERAEDRAELDALIAALEPLVEGQRHA